MHSIKWTESNGGMTKEAEVAADNDNELLKEIAMELITFKPPVIVKVDVDGCSFAEYDLTLRSGTLLISENWIVGGLELSDYDPVYLTMISAENNSYKFYKLTSSNGCVTASYGRIGAGKGEIYGERSCSYPMSMYWPKYYEKLSKGYVDQSDIFIDEEKKEGEIKCCEKNPETPAEILYRRLKAFAEHYIDTNCVSSIVTDSMIYKAEEMLSQLYEAKTVQTFNVILMQLLIISPRKVSRVESLLAKSSDDFIRIVRREENLLSAMKAVSLNGLNDFTRGRMCPFGFDMDIDLVTDMRKKYVLGLLSDKLKPLVKNVYAVTDKYARERFDNYISKRGITGIKQLWHGSRNENWLSIISTGLMLHPNARITGKMFGDGIYFSPSSMKSWGYTSMEGAKWNGSGSGTGFMGLYTTAYGKPLNVYTAHSYSEDTLNGKDCVHAHAGQALRNDEVVFYNEDAMILDYLVEFAA